MTDLVLPRPTRPANPSPRKAISLALTALAMAAITWTGYWLTHLTSLEPYGNEVGASSSIGQTRAFDTFIHAVDETGSDRVTLDSLKPHILQNTSDATIVFVVCRREPGNNAVRIGGKEGDLAEYCTRVDPLRGPLEGNLGYRTNRIVALITPRKAGRVYIAGYDATYRTGLRAGTQRVGVEVSVTS